MIISNDEKYLFTSGNDKIVNVYYVPNYLKICSIECPFQVQNLYLSNDQVMLIAVGTTGEICFW